MKIEKRIFLLLCIFLLCYSLKGENSSAIDYEKLAKEITRGAGTRLEKSEAIYRYICRNIAYDTRYRIYTADECYRSKKGVCQAYCELYQKLCEPLGIDCIMVTGQSKPADHKKGVPIKGVGHSWLLVEAEEEGYYYFVDPTWGAGSVNNGVFERKENDMSWFRVSPEWLIFTHFPDEEEFQLLDEPISEREFLNLPPLRPDLEYMGLNDEELLSGFLNGTINSLPEMTYIKEYPLTIVSVPIIGKLRPSEKYRFSFKGTNNVDYALIHGGEFHQNWIVNGDTWTMEFIPYEQGTLKISAARPGQRNFFEIINYEVNSPDKQEIKRLEEINPFYSTEIRNLPGYSPDIKTMGFDGNRILEELRRGRLKQLPDVVYTDQYPLRVVNVPYNKVLTKGVTYTFEISIPEHQIPVLVHNNTFFPDWEQESQIRKITFTPDSSGDIKICIKNPQEDKYGVFIVYEVK